MLLEAVIQLGSLPVAFARRSHLDGAREILLCKESQKTSEYIAEKIEHVRTNEIEKDFDYVMAENMYFL